eukprot:6174287-Pleurochrysis_carterae.AAC.3
MGKVRGRREGEREGEREIEKGRERGGRERGREAGKQREREHESEPASQQARVRTTKRAMCAISPRVGSHLTRAIIVNTPSEIDHEMVRRFFDAWKRPIE